ncbi:M23 family metallopeptidase [Cellvibrio fibrivorans]|uniref:Murein DD-endopeptidase MepM/ murein hydrolase activator NlpD n=1 Tax=Cellvibrio fibrivorans TaxID=126350 RepID=A0ABU1UZD0_9GAMM|nr:M23 family metallopeptidase [Cellvibrio fibrivorans]MDR7090557.1 murein DD-endopeptidase MepM/ murein hydrolase activator NlpD [Cellvibrio fibrivorans]
MKTEQTLPVIKLIIKRSCRMPGTFNPGPAFTRKSPWNPNRFHPIDKVYKLHRGDDWSAPTGTPIPAAATGKVVKNQVLGGYGNLAILEHLIDRQLVHTWYAHLNVPSPLAIGVSVEAGETVGTV